MNTNPITPESLQRRSFLSRASLCLGSIYLGELFRSQTFGSVQAAAAAIRQAGAERPPLSCLTHAAKAKRVIFLYMAGGPSQFESLDRKPELAKLDGQPMPASVTAGQPIAQLQGQELLCLGPRFRFKQWGASGQEMTEIFPHLGSLADKLCIIRSMHTDQINHDPAHFMMNTGSVLTGRPSMGAWIQYALGSEAQDLPGFVVMASQGGRNPQPISARQWHNGFLPADTQGVKLQGGKQPVYFVDRPPGTSPERQQEVISAVQSLDAGYAEQAGSADALARIRQYEMAGRMQSSIPQVVDLTDEPAHVLAEYGVTSLDGSFAANCLLARRLAERGVRFIQLYHRGWDHHNDLMHFMNVCTGLCDKPAAVLLNDLDRRGLLEDTLVIWGGEFGRTPMAQSNKGDVGRDHHMRSFSMWLAGAGVKPGITYGATDDLGYHAVENPVHVHDLHATVLHLLGIDHLKLTYPFQGRDFRLTDVAGNVVQAILS